MTLRLDLDLEAMLKFIEWDEQNCNDYGRKYSPWDERYKLPYTFSYAVKLTDNNKVVSTAVTFQEYHEQFLIKHFQRRNIFGVSNRHLIQFYSESLSNIFTHGGDGVREDDTTIQLYHPPDPSKFIVKISNPMAKKWDPQIMISQGRGGHTTFEQDFALVSYGNGGKDFLALITPPL